ncbi:hypothetical protein CDD81_7669 [Ophiocordyceps australis]|uniref:Uncharacterized protein n=1 Tax=Ophiocordyceps australis TaxID=1399860 RepID=A0A2C5XGP4_9HYPO|nr:hypothetical protein CDD81_7669 [Ophiocordyceps australis]
MAGSGHEAMAQRSRFLEGSMKDRASAMPPMAFLGPAQQAALEQQVPVATAPRPRRPMMRLGEVWQGVRGRLRLRKTQSDLDVPKPPPAVGHSLSREELFATYHSLVAQGFFASHATPSARQPRPATAAAHATPLPQWPLTPPSRRSSSPLCSPASSRGTKRAATDDDNDHGHDSRARRFLTKRLRRDASPAAPSPPKRLTKRPCPPALGPEPTLLSSPSCSRVLRRRLITPPLSVVPDANRGIPRVPSIPSKYARHNSP